MKRFGVRLLLLSLFSLSALSPAQADELRGVIRNNEGVRKLKAGQTLEAYSKFGDAMVDLPFSPEVHYNLGLAFLEHKEPEKALSEFLKAAQLAQGDSRAERTARFNALFNAAVVSAELKNVAQALGLYQQALELNPESLEVKTNMELLTQQGGGEGEGESQDQQGKGDNDKKDKKDKGQGQDQQDQKDQKPDQNKDQNQPQQGPTPKPSPRPFKSEEISPQDVGRILEELKRQEEQIRAKMQGEGAKDVPNAKDW